MNRQQRRAAAKQPSSQPKVSADLRMEPPAEGDGTALATTNWHYHVTIHDGAAERVIRNVTQEQLVERFALPYKLNKIFRIDGFEIVPARVRRFKATRTPGPFDPAKVFQKVDKSSLTAAFFSLGEASLQMTAREEDVTDDILIQAQQLITAQHLTPEPKNNLDNSVRHDKAFIVMSFAPESREAFDAMKRACETCNIRAVRVDQEMSSGPIMERIIGHLKEANYVIADLTGARPNVYYEIGYFDALCEARGVDPANHMLFVARDIKEDAHFDIRHRGIEQYSTAFALMGIIEKWLQQRKNAVTKPEK